MPCQPRPSPSEKPTVQDPTLRVTLQTQQVRAGHMSSQERYSAQIVVRLRLSPTPRNPNKTEQHRQ
jgi:hypothetical protein